MYPESCIRDPGSGIQ
jgi:hypothetical protein